MHLVGFLSSHVFGVDTVYVCMSGAAYFYPPRLIQSLFSVVHLAAGIKNALFPLLKITVSFRLNASRHVVQLQDIK